jgi:hypothetical protein
MGWNLLQLLSTDNQVQRRLHSGGPFLVMCMMDWVIRQLLETLLAAPAHCKGMLTHSTTG